MRESIGGHVIGPKRHVHVCTDCKRRFVCDFGCTLDEKGVPTDLSDVCDGCLDARTNRKNNAS